MIYDVNAINNSEGENVIRFDGVVGETQGCGIQFFNDHVLIIPNPFPQKKNRSGGQVWSGLASEQPSKENSTEKYSE